MKFRNVALVIVILTSLLILAGAAKNDWTSFTLNNNNTRYQTQSPINSSNVGELVAGPTIESVGGTTSTPIVANGNVYFADWSGYIYSANLSTGNINWKTFVNGAISSTPEWYNNTLYVAFGPNSIADVGGAPFNVPVANDLQIWAINPSTGKAKWIRSIFNMTYGTTGMDAIWDSPIVYNGLLYIGVASSGPEAGTLWKGQEVALNAQTGALVWNVVTTNSSGSYGAGVWSSVVIDPNPKINAIYFGTGSPFNYKGADYYSDSLMSLDASTGKINWVHQICSGGRDTCGDDEFGDTPNIFTFTANNGTTYNAIGDGRKNGNYYIFNRVNGALLENISIGSPETNSFPNGGVIGLAAMTNTTNPELFIPSYYAPNTSSLNEGVVEAFYPSNQAIAWRVVTPGFIQGSISLIPGAVLFGDSTGNVYALSIATGKKLFTANIPDGIYGGVDEAEGYVLAPGFLGVKSTTKSFGIYTFKLPAEECSGNPIVDFNPNPSKADSAVNVLVSNLTNCSGQTVYIKTYEGCTNGVTLTSFTSSLSGGSASITSPGAAGQYGYWACVDSLGSEGTLIVSNTTITTTTTTTTSLTTTTISSSCSGTMKFKFSPNPATPSATVNAIVSGLTDCNGITVNIKTYQGCTSGLTVNSFISNSKGGSALFTAPSANGSYGYWSCITGKNGTEGTLKVK